MLAGGATFSAAGGAVSVSVPAGALAQTTNLGVSAATSPPASARLLAGTAFDFSPQATTFAQPVTITLSYDPSRVTPGNSESELQLYEVVAGVWSLVANSTVDTNARTVSGSVHV